MQLNENEQRLLDLLGRKQMTIRELADQFFRDQEILDANVKVSTMISRINAKCALNKAKWHITGKGLGRQGRTVWKAKA